jgi:hypothetical protein
VIRAEAQLPVGLDPRTAGLDDPEERRRLAAIDGIGELHASDSRILGMLVDQMDHDDPSIRLASLRALRKLTKKDLGVVPEPWREFLAQGNKAQGPASDPGTRRASTER